MSGKSIIITASVLMAIAVALGAFGAHGLKNIASPERINTFQTGVTYHFYHSLAILIIGVLVFLKNESLNLNLMPVYLMLAGIIIFSGSLYLLVITDFPKLGAITPFGGLSFIIAWIWLAIDLFKKL